MDALYIFGAEYMIGAVVMGFLWFAFFLPRQQQLRLGVMTLIALPLAWVLARVAGLFFYHEQPFAAQGFEPLVPHEVDNSFPSDHTAMATVFAALAYVYGRWFGIFLAAGTLFIGLSRVMVGLHYPIDILTAVVLGVGAVLVAKLLSSPLFQAQP